MYQLNLTNEEIVAKMQQLGKGSEEYNKYAEFLLVNNSKMITSIANRFRTHQEVSFDDVEQELKLLMLWFADSFDINKNAKFATYFFKYAPNYVDYRIKKYLGILNASRMINYAKNAIRKRTKEEKVTDIEKSEGTQNVDNIDQILCEELGDNYYLVANQFQIAMPIKMDRVSKSMFAKDEDSKSIEDMLPSGSLNRLEERLEESSYDSLHLAIDYLPSCAVEYVKDYYYNNMTLQEMSDALGKSKQYIHKTLERISSILRDLLTDTSTDVLQKIRIIQAKYMKYTKHSNNKPIHFFSNLPYTFDELLKMIDYCYIKYSQSIMMNGLSAYDTYRKSIKDRIYLEKEDISKLDPIVFDQLIDVCIFREPIEVLAKKYKVDMKGNNVFRKIFFDALEKLSIERNCNQLKRHSVDEYNLLHEQGQEIEVDIDALNTKE